MWLCVRVCARTHALNIAEGWIALTHRVHLPVADSGAGSLWHDCQSEGVCAFFFCIQHRWLSPPALFCSDLVYTSEFQRPDPVMESSVRLQAFFLLLRCLVCKRNDALCSVCENKWACVSFQTSDRPWGKHFDQEPSEKFSHSPGGGGAQIQHFKAWNIKWKRLLKFSLLAFSLRDALRKPARLRSLFMDGLASAGEVNGGQAQLKPSIADTIDRPPNSY